VIVEERDIFGDGENVLAISEAIPVTM